MLQVKTNAYIALIDLIELSSIVNVILKFNAFVNIIVEDCKPHGNILKVY